MLVNYSSSRAAVLCIGGWGLQTMLHLAPRIHAAQEQRAASTVASTMGGETANGSGFQQRGFPNLDRTTRYATVLAEPLLTGDNQTRLLLRRIRQNQTLDPFHVEQLLNGLGRNAPVTAEDRAADLLTASERRAAALLRATEPVLQPIAFDGYELTSHATGLSAIGRRATKPTTGVRRAARGDIFLTALQHADVIARLLETDVFDPIRQDRLAPDDPFVQTTLYVVAPLFEPLSAVLIWPLVSALMARLGRRHITNVVALLATGSYASDLSRPLEDATAMATLAELETLAGLRHSGPRRSEARAALSELVQRASPELARHVGEPIFDHIYLIDREKSNQGVAEDSHELAVLAGNALEAMIVAGGDLFIQEQLGFALRNSEERSYSLIGAASDYVPLHHVLHAVNRQEESRLVREWVLRNTPEETTPAPQAAARPGSPLTRPAADPSQKQNPSLIDLGFAQNLALRRLAQRLPAMFVNGEPAEIDDLAVQPSFILPPSAAADLRRAAPADWPDAFEAHLSEIQRMVDLAAGEAAVAEAWGLAPASIDGPSAVAGQGSAFAAGLEADDRLYPQLLGRMHRRLSEMLAGSPTGLTRAAAQTARWLHEAQESLQRLSVTSTPSTQQIERIQHELAVRDWTVQYERLIAGAPSAGAVALRAFIATALVALLALAVLLFSGATWNWATDGLALGGFAFGIAIAGFATVRISQSRRARARRRRIELAQAELTDTLRRQVHAGLTRAYARIAEVLHGWNQMLNEAIDELQALSTPPRMPALPPADLPPTYLYEPHFNQALWDHCLAYLRSHIDAHGQSSEERLDDLWGQARWRNQMQKILRSIPAEVAPRNDGNGGYAVASDGTAGPAHTIADFIRRTVRESVAPITLEEPNSLRAALIRALASEYSIEHMLWRGEADAQDLQRRLRAMAIAGSELEEVSAETLPAVMTHRRYVEAVWNRAKPTANYDVADRLAVYGVTVEFAAASGAPDSDLTRTLLEEFNVTLLPTGNPFSLTFVRTVHGLSLDDLDCMRRYRAELTHLAPAERSFILLDPGGGRFPDYVYPL